MSIIDEPELTENHISFKFSGTLYMYLNPIDIVFCEYARRMRDALETRDVVKSQHNYLVLHSKYNTQYSLSGNKMLRRRPVHTDQFGGVISCRTNNGTSETPYLLRLH